MSSFSRRFFAVCLIIALVVIGAMQARRLVRDARAKRLAAEAAGYLAKRDFAQASRTVRLALQASPSSIEATRLTADLLDATGSPSAVPWRIRASQLQPLSMVARLDWAQTATKLRDLKSAEDALSGLDEESRGSARYHKIVGALAWAQGKTEEADKHYQQARILEPGNPSNILNLGTIGLVSTNQEVCEAARASLLLVASTNNPYRLDAERRLWQDAIRRRDLPGALVFAQGVATNSDSTFADRIEYLNLLGAVKDSRESEWLAGLKKQAANSPDQAFNLGEWLLRNQGATNALDWLDTLPDSVRTNQPVPLVVSDATIALKDWGGLLACVEKSEWGESDILKLALESLARRSLNQPKESEILWKRARRQSARRLDRLYRLAQLTAAWGWADELKGVLTELVAEFPRERWAVDSLVNQLHDRGETAELAKLLERLSSAEPANSRLKASLARILLLRKDQLAAAHRIAKEAYDKTPEDPVAASTYAYSLLVQGNQDQALRVLDDLAPQSLQIPWVAACYGVIEAQSGNKEAAREPLKRARESKLLPEESELVRIAEAAIN